MSAALTRRAALTGAVASLAGAGIAAAAVAAPFATVALAAGVSPGLAALITASAAAARAHAEHETTVCAPLWADAKARRDALDHTTVTINDRTYTTANREDVRLSGAIVAGGRGRPNERTHYRAHRSFTAAAIRRKRNADRIWRQSGAAAAGSMSDRLSEAWADAQGAVVVHPVSTAADLNAKLAFMIANAMDGESGWLSYIAADAARIAKMEG